MDLSILIVNWKSARYLAGCLASVYRQVKDVEFEVLVIDNASYDGSAELVNRDFPQATFIQSDSNLGFIRGNNLLFRQARGRNILLLNPDTEIVGDAVQAMVRHLDSLPQAGAIGCRLVDAGGATQTNSIQAFPTILNQLLDSDFLMRHFPNSALWKLGPLHQTPGAPVEVDSVSGACLMVKRSVFEQVGLLSDDYVMYSDDFDLCAKVKRAGSKVYFTSPSRVIHYGGRSAAALDRGLGEVWMKDSKHRFLAKFRGRRYAALYKLSMAGAALVRLALIGVLHLLAPSASRREQLNGSLVKWRRILQWAAGAKQWAERASERMGYAAREL